MRIITTFFQAKQTGGFALLMTLLVVSVVVSVGLAMLELSIKQVELSSNAAQSELAFHAANAGMECAKYWRNTNSNDMEQDNAITPSCFGATPGTNTHAEITTDVSGFGTVYQYQYDFTWGTGLNTRCTKANTVVMVADISGDPANPLTLSNANTYIPGYSRSGGDNFSECEPGAICTILSVKGYNKGCGAISGYGVIEREVLLKY